VGTPRNQPNPNAKKNWVHNTVKALKKIIKQQSNQELDLRLTDV
jgi:hypothetical protein